MSNIHISAFTSGENSPASRFRVRQNIAGLSKFNIFVDEHYPFIDQEARLPGRLSFVRNRYFPLIIGAQMSINFFGRIPNIYNSIGSDIFWIQRNFIPYFDYPITLIRKPTVLDIDDSIWLINSIYRRSNSFLAKHVDCIIAGNSFIANWYSQFCERVFIVPTAIDTTRFSPCDKVLRKCDDSFIIGWTGTWGNFKYLKMVERALASFFLKHKNAKLLIIADKEPKFNFISSANIIFEKWSISNEVQLLQNVDIGIMPLTDDDWTRGKCSFKMLQFMALGIPVIVSDVGMNRDVLDKGICGYFAHGDDEWLDFFETLYHNRLMCKQLGIVGRNIIENYYSTEIISKQLSEIFLGLA